MEDACFVAEKNQWLWAAEVEGLGSSFKNMGWISAKAGKK